MSRGSATARRVLLLVLLVACAAAGAWAGLRIAGPATYRTALGDVQLRVHPSLPSRRGVELYVPLADWGLRARTVGAPVAVEAEPRRIDRDGLIAALGRGSQRLPLLRAELEDALRSAVLRAVAVGAAGAAVGGLLALLVWERAGVRGRRLALAPAGAAGLALGAAGVLAGWSALTWAPERLERPTYYASGGELQRLLDQGDELRRTGERYAGRVDVAIRSIAGLLDEGGAAAAADGRGRRIMLASDLHNNVLTLPTLRRFAAGGPVVLPGDFTINGSRLESGLLGGVERLGRPVVAVSGNHDSTGLMRRLARNGVTVLTHRGVLDAHGNLRGPAVRRIAGVTMAGFEDPLAFRGGLFPSDVRTALSFGDLEDGRERFAEAVQQRWTWWRALPRRPQVLVVHQQAIARELANLIWADDHGGPPLAILAGHTHRQRLDRFGPVTVVNGGSAGAGGVFGTGRDAVGFALLDLADGGGGLEAADLVQMQPVDGAAQARRVIVERPDCDGRLVFCHDEPAPLAPPGAPIAAPAGDRGPGSR